MIKPHGSDTLMPLFVSDAEENQQLASAAESLPSVLMSSAGAANAVMLGGGYFTPPTGYMNRADALSLAENMHTTSGLFWPTPVLCLVDSADGLLTGESGKILIKSTPLLDISASDIRTRIQAGEDASSLMPDTVYQRYREITGIHAAR